MTTAGQLVELVRANLLRLAGLETARALVHRASTSTSMVFLEGGDEYEREALARELHYCSPFAKRAFICVRCGGLDDVTLHARLFGREPLDSALEPGVIHEARGGIVLIDGVEHMSPNLQYRMRTFLEDGMFLPVGASRPRSAAVRLIFGSAETLEGGLRDGRISADFGAITVAGGQPPPLARARLLRGRYPGVALAPYG